ncbi:MAG: cytochrome c peroxidase [Cytophagaceae bacterium]
MSLAIVGFMIIIISCKKNENENVEPSFKGFVPPSHFPAPTYNFEKNPVTKEKFELGKALFFDPILSRDGTVSCGTCHKQYAAFSDYDHTVSHGIENKLGIRNSPGLFNLAWHPEFMWDGGINHIEVMPISPITNPVEMDESLVNVVAKLNQSSDYRKKFKAAFNVDIISSKETLLALTQYLGLLISDQSNYDKALRGEYTFTQIEQEGKSLFESKCSSCHIGTLFTDFSYRNNGLPYKSANDKGRMSITNLSEDERKFKVPSLRNIAITRPYMHDGRFSSLEKVLDHYSNGIESSSTLDPLLQNKIPLTEDEKQKLIAFLNTLTDKTFTSNPDFKEPVK